MLCEKTKTKTKPKQMKKNYYIDQHVSHMDQKQPTPLLTEVNVLH